MATTPFLKKASTSLVEVTLQEFVQEASITRRVLERVPGRALAWTPHPKSMSLGSLAFHLAAGPGISVAWVATTEADLPDLDREGRPQPESLGEILNVHELSVGIVKKTLGSLSDAQSMGMCTLRKNGQVFMTMPKLAVLRTLVMNHLIHHRGQLSVYLRLLDVMVPSIYGPSADEKPFVSS